MIDSVDAHTTAANAMRRSQLRDGELLAAVDLGSNSFHMVVARYVLGQLRVIDRLRETVRLAEGLDSRGGLAEPVLERAIDCLSRFGQRIRTIEPHRVRIIATNTVRQLRHPRAFLVPAEAAIGHAIEVVSGREEARLVYLGVAHGSPPTGKRRLVIDIGGGSTEFIIGQDYQPLERESLQMGCVASTRRFFGNGKLSRKRWKEGLTEISAEFQQFVANYRSRGWQDVIGSSGTIKEVAGILLAMKLSRGAITDSGLDALTDKLLAFDDIDSIVLPGLSSDRRPVIAGGLLVLQAAFNELGIKRMQPSKSALREGVLYDMIGRASDQDLRDVSIDALVTRYGIDREQSARVEHTVLSLFDQVASTWILDADERRMLTWAARVHEIGLAIAHSQHHIHGSYLLEHSDIAGFSRQEQQMLAAIVRCQRRGLPMAVINALPERMILPALRCTLLLRLAVLLHRGHDRDPLPAIGLQVNEKSLTVTLPAGWLDTHPLTRADLESERDELKDVSYNLRWNDTSS